MLCIVAVIYICYVCNVLNCQKQIVYLVLVNLTSRGIENSRKLMVNFREAIESYSADGVSPCWTASALNFREADDPLGSFFNFRESVGS
jgi:hypothetical protein